VHKKIKINDIMSGKYFTCNSCEITMVVVKIVVIVVKKNNGELAMEIKEIVVMMIVNMKVMVKWQ